LKRHFARSPLVLLRDALSKRHVLDLGVPDTHLHVHGDVVFSLLTEDATERLRSRRLPETGLSVAISVRSWHRFKSAETNVGRARYIQTVAAVARDWIERRGARCEFISTCQGIPEYWTHDDDMAEQIVLALPPELRKHVTVNRGFHHPLALRDHLARFDVVFATRMHAAILALTAGTPVLPLAYESKTRELFEALNFADVCLDIDQLSPAGAVATAERFLHGVDGRRAELAARVQAQAESACAVVERLQQLGERLNLG
jgi:colanic acid/amylovoran biosynthesis protein